MRNRATDLGLGAVATLGLGAPFVLISIAQQAMPTATMAAARVVLAAAMLVAVLAVARSPAAAARELGGLLRRHPLAVTVVAIGSAVAPNLLIGAAERHVPTGTIAVILATTPMWIALGATAVGASKLGSGALGADRLRARQWVALPFAILGVALAAGAAAPPESWPWCALALAASFSYAASALVLRRWLHRESALPVVAAEMLVAAVVLMPVAVVAGGQVRWDAAAWAAVAVAGIGCTGAGWLANTALMQRVGAAAASVTSYTSVVVSIALGVVVLAEPLTARVAAGTALLVASIALFVSPARRRAEPLRKDRIVLELSILGFLAESPMHAYELRRRISALTGHVRPVSDGALTPALRRLERRGLLERSESTESGGPPRIVFGLTAAGDDELLHRLRDADGSDVSDRNRWFTVLAFLHHLGDPAEQRAVLERRLAFLEEPSRGFFAEGTPGAQASPFRRGMNAMARDIWQSEHRWLSGAIAGLAT
ncbi:EamA family transporter [Agromyces larvae]|uniref:EamA family transporter n=1 Tax=Agromyces larvae TaxID=2929802 RepID=A0ABY4C3Z4_9MICO|nr:EamA family transporter [Agromyces larvae]UOE46193.1 EamA family transporter [Agromyces larvae]